MTKFGRSTTISWPFFWGAGPCGHFPGTDAPTRSRNRLPRPCLDSYGQLSGALYVQPRSTGLKVNLSRTWTWEPKTGQVTTKQKQGGKPSGYLQPVTAATARGQRESEIDSAFVNDNYWFIFPFHAYWDTSANVTVKDKQKLPIGQGTAKLVSVKYPMEVGGYTPGDTWDLYVGKDGRIVHSSISGRTQEAE